MSGGLRLPVTIAGVGEKAQEEIHSKWSTYEYAKEFLERQYGMVPPQEPNWAPPVLTLKDLTESAGKDYTDKYMQLTGWYGYLSEVKSRVSAQVLELDNEMKQIEASMRENMRSHSTKKTKSGESKAPPLAEMEDKIRLDPRYIELGIKKQGFEQMEAMLTSRINKHEYEIKLMSRQVEIKRAEFDHNTRESSISGNRGAPLRTPGDDGPSRRW
jgi:predicted RNA-binding protein with RPS1 domain